MKKVLFVINTLGKAGAEVSLLNLLASLPEDLDISLFVLANQGELVSELPSRVHLLNKNYKPLSVLSKDGKKALGHTVLKALLLRGGIFKNCGYILKNLFAMLTGKVSGGSPEKGIKNIRVDKLLWKMLSDTSSRYSEEFDLAVAFIEGGATYYVADHVKAKKKVAFVHVDYEKAGYTRALDLDVYNRFDKIFTVSKEVGDSFIKIHPEVSSKVEIFRNILNIDKIREKAEKYNEEDVRSEKTEASDMLKKYMGSAERYRFITVGRLTPQKNWEVSIEAAGILKKQGVEFSWLLLGEGEERERLSSCIKEHDVEDCFFMPGAVENPYPYMKKADIYIHCSAFEGKSIAIQEAKILGKAIIVSDVPGNREQIEKDKNGVLVHFEALSIAKAVIELIILPEQRKAFEEASLLEAKQLFAPENTDVGKLMELL